MADAQRQTPLRGVKVLDLGQFIAIPYASLWLAWMGAEVIVVESRRRMTTRTAPPFIDGWDQHPDASGYFNMLYSSKKSCTIDMTTAAGKALVQQLAAKVDVIVDNFSTGVMEKLGLGYEQLSQLNPKLIMVSNGAFGRYGPMKNSRGLHSTVNLFSGVSNVTGYAGGHPRILGGCVPDPLSGIYSCFGLMSALFRCRKTGRGEYIDVAMYETMLSLIPEAVIDFSLNGIAPEPQGNRDSGKAPHGIYRCREPDTWVAISVDGEEEWSAFCGEAKLSGLADNPLFGTLPDRLANVAELDSYIERWTSTVIADEVVVRLQKVRVAARRVLRVDELMSNEQLVARGMVVETTHPIAGSKHQLGLPWTADTFDGDYRGAPLLGADTRSVLGDLLGIKGDDFESLVRAGVLN